MRRARGLGTLIALVLLAQLLIFTAFYYNLASPPPPLLLSPSKAQDGGGRKDQNNGLKRKLHDVARMGVTSIGSQAQDAPLDNLKNSLEEREHPKATHSSSESPETLITRSQVVRTDNNMGNTLAGKVGGSSKNASSRENNEEEMEIKSHIVSSKSNKSVLSPERLKRLKPKSVLQGMDSEQSLEDQQRRRASILRERAEDIVQESQSVMKQLKTKHTKSVLRRTDGEREDVLVNSKKKNISEGKYSFRKTMRDTEKEMERAKDLNRLWEERKKQKIENHTRDYSKYKAKDYFEEVCSSTQEPLVECSKTLPTRDLDQFEASGKDIMYTIRTTFKYHDVRMPFMMDTWLGDVDPENVFIVTDADDEDLEWKASTLGMNYVNIHSGTSHNQSDLCCKAGVELELLMLPKQSNFNWVCHVDDDMYVNPIPLAKLLSRFNPAEDEIYIGRSGSTWGEPWKVKEESRISTPGKRYHFAVGGMYCLSRAMLEYARQYLVGCKAFEKSCSDSNEPEDVTVGLIIGAVLDLKLHRTEMIYTHGIDLLSSTPTPYLKYQVAFSYGYGAEGAWTVIPNVVYVPGGLFSIDEDITQFKSLHCHLYPKIEWCLDKKKQIVEDKKGRESNSVRQTCECSWKKIVCCNVYKENYYNFMTNEKKKKLNSGINKLKDKY